MTQTRKSAKSMAIEAVMRSPKMRRTLNESLASPIGSTKRAKCRAMLSSLSKVSERYVSNKSSALPLYSKKNPWGRFKMPQGNAYPPQSVQDGQGGALDGSGAVSKGLVPMSSQALMDLQNQNAFVGAEKTSQSPTGQNAPVFGGWLANAVKQAPGAIVNTAKNAALTGLRGAADVASLAYLPGAGIEAFGNKAKNKTSAVINDAIFGRTVLPEGRNEDWTQTMPGKASIYTESMWDEKKPAPSQKFPELGRGQPQQQAPMSAEQIPFVPGLPEAQKQTVIKVFNKKLSSNQWTDVEKANWNKATNNAPFPMISAADVKIPSSYPDKYKNLLLESPALTPDQEGSKLGDVVKQQSSIPGSTISSSSDSSSSDSSSSSSSSSGSAGPAGTSGPTGSAGASGLTGWDSLSSKLKALIDSGTSPEVAIQSLMSDSENAEAIKKIFPDTPVEFLPLGGSSTERVEDLRVSKAKEMGLDAAKTKYDELLKNGANLTGTLTDYVKQKDEYIAHIDQMMEKETAANLANPNRSNPDVQAKNEQYMQYLQVMKGKQYQRYSDVLNSSIAQYNTQTQQAADNYANIKAEYEQVMVSGEAAIKENYKTLYDGLAGQYKQLSASVMSASDAADLEGKLIDNQSKMLKLTEEKKKALGISSGSSGSASSGDLEKGLALAEKMSVGKTTNELIPSANISDAIANTADNGYDRSGKLGVLQGHLSLIANELLAKPADSKSSESAAQKFEKLDNILKTYTKNQKYIDLLTPSPDLKNVLDLDLSNMDAITFLQSPPYNFTTEQIKQLADMQGIVKMNAIVSQAVPSILTGQKRLVKEAIADFGSPDTAKSLRKAIDKLRGVTGKWYVPGDSSEATTVTQANAAAIKTELMGYGLPSIAVDALISWQKAGALEETVGKFMGSDDKTLINSVASSIINGPVRNGYSAFIPTEISDTEF
jgi:hypothetical protein